MVSFTVSITLSSPGMKRLVEEAEKEGKSEEQIVREIIQKKYDKKE